MTYTEYFELICPYYMLYGMTYEQFWYGEPWMAKAYKDKHNLERRQRNEEMWVNGIYQLSALGVALHNAFDKNKIKYMSEPLDIFPKTEAEKEAEKRDERQKLIEWLNMWTTSPKEKQTGS